MPAEDQPDIRAPLRAGVAVYNAGEYHAAHDAWEDHWLGLASGTDDERLLHGLIQFTAALHHARHANWTGLAGLVASAREYLAGLPADHRGVDLAPIRTYLDALHADPEYVERVAPPPMTHEGAVLHLEDLQFAAAAEAAEVFAEEHDRFDEEPVERAARYAGEAIDAGDETDPLVTLVMDFARDPANRDVIYQRLTEHVKRRDRKRENVEGLFDGAE